MKDVYSQSAFSQRVEAAVSREGSYEKAAKKCGVERSTLFKIANGREPSFKSYRAVFRWLTGKEPPLP